MDTSEIESAMRRVLAEDRAEREIWEEGLTRRITSAVLRALGVDPDDPDDVKDARRGLNHSRASAHAVAQIGMVGVTTIVITVIGGLLGVLWIGIRALLSMPILPTKL